ncbi:MAG: DUF4376 domain-containing protein [Hyphomicrobiaceae bacterium]|nr:DUF4376 domain-containing protein [Hyphomicrobiaceae bacterium]
MPLYTRAGSVPAPLPYRIILADGRSRTDPATFTAPEIADAGYVEAPAKPSFDPDAEYLDWTGSDWAVESQPYPSAEDVNRERDRRTLAGKTFTVTGYGDIPVAGDATSQLNLLALKDTARDLKAANVTAAVIPYRDAVNGQHQLTADQIIELVDAGKAQVQLLYSKSWALKAMDPIPRDFTDDSYWT